MSNSSKNLSAESTSRFIAYFKALRPRQWTKNLIVFAAPLFAFSITVPSLVSSLTAFVLFCCASSSFYLINDITDVDSDRLHPIKCHRPIASGLVSIPAALIMAALLLGTALIIGWLKAPGLGSALAAYAVLQVAYNLRLKRAVILDVIAIAIGFILRAYAGAAATGITLSPWFLLCTAMLALFLGIEKRKAELRLSDIRKQKTRIVLRSYSLGLLNRMENIVTSGTIMTYMLWSAGPMLNGASTPWMMLTLPFVIYGVFRYQYLSDPQEIERRNPGKESGGQTERPEEVLLKDRSLRLAVLAWLLTLSSIFLLKKNGFLD